MKVLLRFYIDLSICFMFFGLLHSSSDQLSKGAFSKTMSQLSSMSTLGSGKQLVKTCVPLWRWQAEKSTVTYRRKEGTKQKQTKKQARQTKTNKNKKNKTKHDC